MNGVDLAARYAFVPNRLHYCGQPTFIAALRSARPRTLETELKKFAAHYGYLELIAAENGKKPFDLDVVRAFWTGNGLLDHVSSRAIGRFFLHVLPKNPARALKLARNLPAGAVPHHSLNPLYVHFITDKVVRTIRNYDSCCVTWGKILSLSGKSATISRHSLGKKAGKLMLVLKRSRVALEKNGVRFVPALRTGDTVSIHWGMAIERLTPAQSAALERYTRKNINALNAASAGA